VLPSSGGGVVVIGIVAGRSIRCNRPAVLTSKRRQLDVYSFCFVFAEIRQKPSIPTYLPTYPTYGKLNKKEITGWVKVGYYTN